MKKYFFALLCIFAATSFAVAQSDYGQKGKNGLYGDVKSCKQFNVKATSQFGNVVTSDTTYISERQYNMEGDEIGFRSWSPTTELVAVYELREDGTKIHGQKYSNSVLESEYWYNEKGLVKRMWTVYTTGTLKGKTSDVRYVYNDFGKHLADTSYNENGELKHLTIYKYNSDSLLEERTVYQADGGVLSSTKYYYDENKRETMTAEAVAYSDSKNYTETKYDSKGRKSKFVRSSSSRASETTYSYLDFGHDECTTMLETVTTKTGQTFKRTDYEYEYDDHGNWIKKITYDVNIGNEIKTAKQVQYREIVYF